MKSFLNHNRSIYIKSVGTLFCILMGMLAIGQDCQSPSLYLAQKKMNEFIQKYESGKTLSYFDSVSQTPDIKKLRSCEEYSYLLLARGEALELENDFENALLQYQQLYDLSEASQWWKITTHACISMARCYEHIQQSAECLRYLMLARTMIAEHRLDTLYARFCKRYASYHRIFDNKDSARVYARLSIRLGHQYGVYRSVFDGHLLMGILTTELDSAIYHFRKATEIFISNGDFHGAASQSMNICRRLIEAERLTEAKSELSLAFGYIEKMEEKNKNYYSSLYRYYQIYSHIFEKNKQYDSAFHYLKTSFEYSKKAEFLINQEIITANAVDFAIERQKEKTKNLETYYAIMKWGLIVLSLGILLFWILLKNNISKKKEILQQNELIQSQNKFLEQSNQKQSMLLAEIHHRVKNNLQLIISLLRVRVKDPEHQKLEPYLEDISDKIRGISLIHEQLYSTGEFEKIEMKSYLNNLLLSYRELNTHEQAFDFKLDADPVHLNLETAMPIGIICSELIGNSIKHARIADKKMILSLSIRSLDDRYELLYTDNGPGLPDQSGPEKKSNLGMGLLKNMARQLQAEYEMYNRDGACFKLSFREKLISKL